MALASTTITNDSAGVSTALSTAVSSGLDASQAQSEAVIADSKAVSAGLDASEAQSEAVIADSIADAAIIDASEAKSTGLVDSAAASTTKSLAVYSDPASNEYPVRELVMDASLDMIVTYDDSSIA